jgi:hypothetical protein
MLERVQNTLVRDGCPVLGLDLVVLGPATRLGYVVLVKLTVVSYEPFRQPRHQVWTEAISSQRIGGFVLGRQRGIDLNFAIFAEDALLWALDVARIGPLV